MVEEGEVGGGAAAAVAFEKRSLKNFWARTSLAASEGWNASQKT